MGRADARLGSGVRRRMSGVTLDAGPLIQLDHNQRKVIALLVLAEESGSAVVVPGAALTQAIRNPARQARLARLLRQPRTEVVALDRVDATSVGRLLAASGTSDIADAHVVVCARRAGTAVVTSDPEDLRALDHDLALITV